MVFNGVVSRCMWSYSGYIFYNGWKAGMLYSRYVYGGH